MTDTDSPPKPAWQIDKRIPIIPALLLVMQTASLVWYAAKVDSRLMMVERWVESNANVQVSLTEMRGDVRGHEHRLTRLEAQR